MRKLVREGIDIANDFWNVIGMEMLMKYWWTLHLFLSLSLAFFLCDGLHSVIVCKIYIL